MKNKFNAVRISGYASKLERDYHQALLLMEKAGQISNIVYQPSVELEPGIRFKPDFSFVENGRTVWVDTKGVITERFRLICKIWKLHGPGPLRVVKRDGVKFCVAKTINPN